MFLKTNMPHVRRNVFQQTVRKTEMRTPVHFLGLVWLVSEPEESRAYMPV